ncbi:hypothetical protein IT418_00900 [bacterium]|nr:hypothetical protein [bacterium]
MYLKEKGIVYELVDKEKYGVFLQSYIPHVGDWGLVYDFGKILPEDLLQNLLMINIHFSLLPKFRGAIPVEAAILTGEKETGITFQKMVKEMDMGDIIFSHTVAIEPQWTSGELQKYMDSLLPGLLDKLFTNQKQGIVFTPQQGEGSICYKRELNRVAAKINFAEMTAEEIIRKVRAYNPEPLAWTDILRNGKSFEMNLLRGSVFNDLQLEPKKIQFLKQKGLAIGTKKGTVLITSLTIAGSKQLNGGDIVALKGSLELS